MKNIEVCFNIGDYVYMPTYRVPVKAKIRLISIRENEIIYYTNSPMLAYFTERDIGNAVFSAKDECKRRCAVNR